MKITVERLKQIIKEEIQTVLEQRDVFTGPTKAELAAEKAGIDLETLEAFAMDPDSDFHHEAVSALQALSPPQYGAPGMPSRMGDLGPPHDYSAGYERDFALELEDLQAAEDAKAEARLIPPGVLGRRYEADPNEAPLSLEDVENARLRQAIEGSR